MLEILKVYDIRLQWFSDLKIWICDKCISHEDSFFKQNKCVQNNGRKVDVHKMEFTKILLLSKTYRKSIGFPSETDMSDRWPIGDQNAWSETDMPHRKPIGNWHACWSPTRLIRDQYAWWDNDMPCLRPVIVRYDWLETHRNYISDLFL